jgi:threonine synthase
VALPPALLDAIRAEVSAVSISEETTREQIAHAHATWGQIVCPHTAVALSAARGADRDRGPVVALSTAHPAKFGKDVAPVLGFDPDPPRVIRELGDRAERFEIVNADASAALAAVRAFAG